MVVKDDQGRIHVGNPIKFASEDMALSFASPTLNQHADQLLKSLGYSDGDVVAFKKQGVLG